MSLEKEREKDPLLERKVLIVDNGTASHFLRERFTDLHSMGVVLIEYYPPDLAHFFKRMGMECAIFHLFTINDGGLLRRCENQILKVHKECPRVLLAEGNSVSREVNEAVMRLNGRGIPSVSKANEYQLNAEQALKELFKKYPDP